MAVQSRGVLGQALKARRACARPRRARSGRVAVQIRGVLVQAESSLEAGRVLCPVCSVPGSRISSRSGRSPRQMGAV